MLARRRADIGRRREGAPSGQPLVHRDERDVEHVIVQAVVVDEDTMLGKALAVIAQQDDERLVVQAKLTERAE